MPVSIQARVDAQREYFSKGHTLPVAARLDALRKLPELLCDMPVSLALLNCPLPLPPL